MRTSLEQGESLRGLSKQLVRQGNESTESNVGPPCAEVICDDSARRSLTI